MERVTVATVVEALRHMGVDEPGAAERLLGTYARRDELSEEQKREVIEHFRGEGKPHDLGFGWTA